MRPDVRFCRRERTRGYAPSGNRLYGRSRVTADELPGTADDLPSCSHRPRAGTRHPYYHALSAKTFRRCNRAGSGAPRDGPGPLRSGNVRAARAIRKTASRPALLLCERRREITAPGDIATQIRFARETLTTTPRPRRATPSSPASGPTAATASPRCPSARGLSSPLPVGVVDHRPPSLESTESWTVWTPRRHRESDTRTGARTDLLMCLFICFIFFRVLPVDGDIISSRRSTFFRRNVTRRCS